MRIARRKKFASSASSWNISTLPNIGSAFGVNAALGLDHHDNEEEHEHSNTIEKLNPHNGALLFFKCINRDIECQDE